MRHVRRIITSRPVFVALMLASAALAAFGQAGIAQAFLTVADALPSIEPGTLRRPTAVEVVAAQSHWNPKKND